VGPFVLVESQGVGDALGGIEEKKHLIKRLIKGGCIGGRRNHSKGVNGEGC